MPFENDFPRIATLLGDQLVTEADNHRALLAGVADQQIVNHLRTCRIWPWCNGYTSGITWIHQGIVQVEAMLEIIHTALPARVHPAYSHKAKNADQYEQLCAELIVASRCAQRATLLDLEWRTGVGTKDADVRAEIDSQPVNIEVTLRTDNWFSSGTTEELEEDGISFTLNTPKPRPMMADSEKGVLEESGVTVRPGAEREPLRPEHTTVRDLIQGKAQKFQATGINLVALCAKNITPGAHHVEQAVYGAIARTIRRGSGELELSGVAGGLFADDSFKQLSGVLFIYTPEEFSRVGTPGPYPDCRNRIFTNGHAATPIPDSTLRELERVFDARSYIGRTGSWTRP
jgi:hypothetical protein